MFLKKKGFISFVIISLILSFIVIPIKLKTVQKDSNTLKSYVVIYKDGTDHKVDTIKINHYEAAKMERKKDVLIAEEDGLVYGSKKERARNIKSFYTKESQKKKVQRESSKNLDAEWNMQIIKADKITAEDLYSESVVTGPAFNVVTGPAVNVNTDTKVKVAIIDSGVDYTDDIDVYMRKNFIPGEDDVSIIYEDVCGHGTSAAGIIAAKDNDFGITGINPDVQLYSARVLDQNDTAPVSRVAEAIYWAIDNDVNIINISFGTTKRFRALEQAVKDAYNAGILLIAAAGNNKVIEYPAAYDEVIAVGSVNSKGMPSEDSAAGEELELMAPGEQILSTGDFGGITVSSGTSMSAPHVTGAVSILWQKDLSCSSDFIRKLLDFSANLYGDSEDYGYGLIDLKYALEQYNAFKSVYKEYEPFGDIIEEARENGELPHNTSEVITFDDVDYVEGTWLSGDHTNLAGEDSYDSGNPLSASDLKIVKLGAVASDTIVPGFTTYPQFHGFMTKKAGTPTYKSNYIASYIYLTNKAVGLNNSTPPIVPSYLTSNDQTGIDTYLTDSGFNGEPWTALLNENTVNAANKALYVYGAALHSVTDLFAHSTYDTDGSYINHKLGADNRYYVENRFLCAQIMARKVIQHINKIESGDITDFYTVAHEPYDGSFYLGRFSRYVQTVNSNYYNAHRDVFDLININK